MPLKIEAVLLLTIATCLATAAQSAWLPNLTRIGRRWSIFPDSQVETIDRDAGLSSQRPIGVRKMSDDEGEMFFPEYWSFSSSQTEEAPFEKRTRSEANRYIRRGILGHCAPSHELDNLTLQVALEHPFALHDTSRPKDLGLSILPHLVELFAPVSKRLSKRGFQCVDQTTPCTSINRPDSCCATGTTCQLIPDTGSGDVGCCPEGGGSCSDQVSGCGDGYESCPGAEGGGCCIPGYSCAGVGCKSRCAPHLIASIIFCHRIFSPTHLIY